MASVLIVDDTCFVRFAIRKIIEIDGHTVIGEAMDGQQAINQYFRLMPDVVILDVTLPTMDGIDVLKEVYAKDPSAKIIMCSAYGHVETIKKALIFGAVDFIIKPFKNERLTDSINRVTTAENVHFLN